MGEIKGNDELFDSLEAIRNKQPVVYNIETTNRCNMRCQMCPRTTMMTRKIEDIDASVFNKVVEQINPHDDALWSQWRTYCENKYGISEDDAPSENHFYLYVISKVIQLHGYGDPLLDKNMEEYIRVLTERGFPTYFSCNPANIDLAATYRMLDAGLKYIKYSIESVNDERYRQIRGKAANFSNSYGDILQVLDYKEKHDLDTTVVITMLDLNRSDQNEEYYELKKAFGDLDVYIYLKSEDCQWYRKDYHGTKSIHWSEPCKHPWLSMTVKSNGEVAMCMEDFNNEIILGDIKFENLFDIWNGEQYKQFRRQHIERTASIKCYEQCDMKLVNNIITTG